MPNALSVRKLQKVQSMQYALLYCGKICDVWWNWQSCPTNLLAETYDIVDVALQILESSTSHDLDLVQPKPSGS